ncbi:hypothetical protein COU80_03610 [Candidatus Peregrinibacteria bacterium CG10_big_fil_rev_8_21_14_0_10_55_24]|nr:MAG: hypothetical protein COU80_03610 [Candidatus Peregrinibacteria bacterium CG10_big_fil_rev_8_21_14_0_10_55_24]
MSDFAPESWSPEEGAAGGPEALSEEAKQRFAAAAAAMQQIRREEKRSKKRDDQVAKAIIQFLGDANHARLFVLVSRLVARNCPSIFILAILSLIHAESLKTVEEYLAENGGKSAEKTVDEQLSLTTSGALDTETNHALVAWITRMQLVLSLSPQNILLRLMVDGRNLDGSVLQLATFVVAEFFEQHNRSAPFEKIQPLTASMLQAVFQPFMPQARKALSEQQAEAGDYEEDPQNT